MYPGSVIHYKEMTDTLRPEDFDIDYKSSNSFKFLGNGLSRREVYEENPDLAYYIQ